MFAALADGQSIIQDPLLGQDCLATLAGFEALGVQTRWESDRQLAITSAGPQGFRSPQAPIDCGNSGTTARLFCGLFAGVPDLKVTLTGDDSLSQRPMRRVVDPLCQMGAHISYADKPGYLPLTIEGKPLTMQSQKLAKASAQVKSALIFAGLSSTGTMEIRLPTGARDHTERLIRRLGGFCRTTLTEAEEIIEFRGPWQPGPLNCRIPVDPSSVAFFAVYGLLQQTPSIIRLPEILANKTRLGFLDVLQRMSSGLSPADPIDNPDFIEPVFDLTVTGGAPLRATEIRPGEVPTLVDEIPILAVAAAFAEGTSRFRGLDELRVKESDRLAKTAELLTKTGVDNRIEGDDLIIVGQGRTATPAFEFDPVGDHRLAMAAAILAKYGQQPSRIMGADCVDVSFPGFFTHLTMLSESNTHPSS
jgi:3-phosphoshikimate 1-carboxyvinyltransferase